FFSYSCSRLLAAFASRNTPIWTVTYSGSAACGLFASSVSASEMITTLPSFAGGGGAAAGATFVVAVFGAVGKVVLGAVGVVTLGAAFFGVINSRAGASSLRTGSFGSSARCSPAVAVGPEAASLMGHCLPTTQPARKSKAAMKIQPATSEITDFLS